MALFSRKTKDTKTEAPQTAAAPKEAKTTAPGTKASLAHVLTSPRITEKASLHMERSAYVFEVAPSANKKQVAAAIEAAYSVKPRQIRIVNVRPKAVRNIRTGKRGVKQGGKKAYVYLKAGETISIT